MLLPHPPCPLPHPSRTLSSSSVQYQVVAPILPVPEHYKRFKAMMANRSSKTQLQQAPRQAGRPAGRPQQQVQQAGRVPMSNQQRQQQQQQQMQRQRQMEMAARQRQQQQQQQQQQQRRSQGHAGANPFAGPPVVVGDHTYGVIDDPPPKVQLQGTYGVME